MIELFLDFKKEKTQESFDKLDFIKKRHVFAEERAIIMLQSSDREFPEMLPVLEQHRVIGETMDRIRQNFISKLRDYEGDLDKVIDLMKKHVIFENKIFYRSCWKWEIKFDKYIIWRNYSYRGRGKCM